jgi:proton-coupled amino acid transporter
LISESKYRLSFSEIGEKAYGKVGKIAVDFFLAFSQTCFVCAYIEFDVRSINNILNSKFEVPEINPWWIGLGCFIFYAPLVLVRKIEKFANFHILADIAIVVSVLTITCYAAYQLHENGKFSHDTQPLNPKTFASFIGLAAYTFEGIGIILPVMETTANPKQYPFILALVCISLTSFYLFFGNFCYFIYGDHKLNEQPMIVDIMPSKDIPIVIIKCLWLVNLIPTYALVIHPANMVVESYLFKGVPKSK